MAASTAAGPQWPWAQLFRLLVCAAAVTVAVVCGAAIGGADPVSPPTPPQPPPATTAPIIPAPTPATPTPTVPVSPVTPGGSGEHDCGVTNISGCVATAIDGFFERLVSSALNPLLDLLTHTLLTTPDPSGLLQVHVLWASSWQLVLGMYGLVVMAVGVLLMLRETLQTRWGVQELAPRLVLGFLGAAMSMWIATQAIRFANALAITFAGDGLKPDSAAAALRELMITATSHGLFLILIGAVLVVAVTLLLITYVVRVSITVVLVVAAPLALMCYALPGGDAIARWWWRAFGACLAIQVVQSLVLITALRVFLSPGGWNFFGTDRSGLVNLVIAMALMGILIKTPFWLMSAMKIGNGRSFVGTVARGFVMYKTFGLVRAAEKTAVTALRSSPPPSARPGTGRGASNGSPSKPKPSGRSRSQPASKTIQQPATTNSAATRGAPSGSGVSAASLRRNPPGPHRGMRVRSSGQYRPPAAAVPAPPQRRTQVAKVKPPVANSGRGRQPTPRVNPHKSMGPVRGGPVRRIAPHLTPATPAKTAPKPVPRPTVRPLRLPPPNLLVRRRVRRNRKGSSQ